jgi:hypothetical protein
METKVRVRAMCGSDIDVPTREGARGARPPLLVKQFSGAGSTVPD